MKTISPGSPSWSYPPKHFGIETGCRWKPFQYFRPKSPKTDLAKNNFPSLYCKTNLMPWIMQNKLINISICLSVNIQSIKITCAYCANYVVSYQVTCTATKSRFTQLNFEMSQLFVGATRGMAPLLEQPYAIIKSCKIPPFLAVVVFPSVPPVFLKVKKLSAKFKVIAHVQAIQWQT